MKIQMVNIQFFMSTNDREKKYRFSVIFRDDDIENSSNQVYFNQVFFSPELIKQAMATISEIEELGYTPLDDGNDLKRESKLG